MERIKVLMFGWELPPFNSGGWGVACYGLAKALAKKGVDITFVLPRKVDVQADFMKIIFASDRKAFPKQWNQQITYTYSALYKKTKYKHTYNKQFSSLLEEVAYYGAAAELIAKKKSLTLFMHMIGYHLWPACKLRK